MFHQQQSRECTLDSWWASVDKGKEMQKEDLICFQGPASSVQSQIRRFLVLRAFFFLPFLPVSRLIGLSLCVHIVEIPVEAARGLVFRGVAVTPVHGAIVRLRSRACPGFTVPACFPPSQPDSVFSVSCHNQEHVLGSGTPSLLLR